MTTQTSKDDSKPFHLPPGRIRVIMKSSGDPEIKVLQTEAIYVVTRATEMFVQYLTKGSYKMFPEKPILDYHALSNFADTDVKLEILQQILPKKITMKDYRDMKQLNKLITDEDTDDDNDEVITDDEDEDDDDNKNTSTENEDDSNSNDSTNDNSSSASSSAEDDNEEKLLDKEEADEEVEAEAEDEEEEVEEVEAKADIKKKNKVPVKTDKNKKR